MVATTGWRDGFAEQTERLVDAWSDPTALDGVSPGMGLPQEVVGQMALLDLTLHPWDLAMAHGQAYQPVAGAVAEPHVASVKTLKPREPPVIGKGTVSPEKFTTRRCGCSSAAATAAGKP